MDHILSQRRHYIFFKRDAGKLGRKASRLLFFPEYTTDIPADGSTFLPIVVRMPNEEVCDGFDNESYRRKWRNPDWKLGSDVYLAKIRIKTGGGREFIDAFKIINDVPYSDFRLEYLTDSQLRQNLGIQ